LKNASNSSFALPSDIVISAPRPSDKEISSEAFGRFFRPVEERQKQLEEETAKLQADVDLLKIDSFSRDQVIDDAKLPSRSLASFRRPRKTQNC
jgi:hypothetical protein